MANSGAARTQYPPIRIPTSKPDLFLRTARPGTSDAKCISMCFSHPANMKYVNTSPNPKPLPPELYEGRIPGWLEATSKDESCFMVICLRTGKVDDDGEDYGEVIGFGGINALGFKSIDGKGENVRFSDVGVLIHEPYQGRGYAKAALEATIEASFELWGVDVIALQTASINVPFRSLMRKIGLGEGKEVNDEIAWEFGRTEWADRGV